MRFYETVADQYMLTKLKSCSGNPQAVIMDKLTKDPFRSALRKSSKSSSSNHNSQDDPHGIMAREMFATCLWSNAIACLADYTVQQIIFCYGYYIYSTQRKRRTKKSTTKQDENGANATNTDTVNDVDDDLAKEINAALQLHDNNNDDDDDDDGNDEPVSDTNSTANRSRGLLTNKNHVPTRSWLKEASERAFLQKPNVRPVGEASMTGGVAKPSPPQRSTRRLGEDDIVPGRGWYASGWKNTKEFCDGSAQSTCGRSSTNECLMAGHNDNHKQVAGTSLSGWVVFHLPKLKEGIILARMEWWCGQGDAMSKEWTEVNDGKTLDETPYNGTNPFRERNLLDFMGEEEHQRRLKPGPEQLVPQDMKMDVAINGKIIKTWEREEWMKSAVETSKNCALWPLLDDESWDQGDEPVELAIRFRIDSNPHQGYCISHIYYA
uniref:Uncharacterized protein n=1 Tax=Attheya septentrionalis TaxID=420275 RepID=A0A6T7GFJ6_9STRA|mmetsp:Transcript_15836/g.28817  ORF Transcript_15836/g.28817 Transcript_15836/m.28817 type:complete len:436 (+) Transcript_15836:291-1598(+)